MTKLGIDRKPLPSREKLRELFSYDPEAGELRNAQRRGGHGRVGEIAGCINKQGRQVVCIDWKYYQASRIIWKMITDDEPPVIDHQDRNPSNNKWNNLRAATTQENSRNKTTAPGATGVRGVFRKANGRYCAYLYVMKRKIYLGTFDDLLAAEGARVLGERRIFGEFSVTNNSP